MNNTNSYTNALIVPTITLSEVIANQSYADGWICPDCRYHKGDHDDLILKEGEVIKYGWDGKPMICKDESEDSKITVEYLVANQGEDKEERVLVQIFSYMEDLMWADKFNVIDDFIKDFCKEDICFQYCLCLLTAACWAKDKIKNKEMLVEKTKQQGIKEIGEKDTNSCLRGLL